MRQRSIADILKALNHLFEDNTSLHSVSFQFEEIASMLKSQNLKIKTRECTSYYPDKKLNVIYSKIKVSRFEEAARQKEILDSKKNSKTLVIIEPQRFEFKDNCFTGYLVPSERGRLITLLIENYNLLHE